MSLTEALSLSQSGLTVATRRISNASNNITNADTEGFTRKSLETQFISTETAIYPFQTIITNDANALLSRAVVEDSTPLAFEEVESRYLTSLIEDLGTTGGQNTFSDGYSNLLAALESLATNPEGGSAKVEVVNAADELAIQVRRYAGSIQEHRARADSEIDTVVRDINRLLTEIDTLNDKIVDRTNSDVYDRALDLKDQRQIKLEELSGLLDIQYFTNSEDRVNIYATGGPALLTGVAKQLSFTPTGIVDSATTYPAGFNPIDFQGTDVTTILKGGKLGALVQMRDATLVNEQQKIDEFTTQMMDQVNAALNAGASVPGPNQMVGQTGFTLADPIASAGSFRIARIDSAGDIVGFSDINTAAFATVNDVVVAINAVAGITAALDPDGRLTITATNAAEGLAINEMTTSVGANNRGISHYFGLNNLFDGDTLYAEQLQVKEEFRQAPQTLPTGTLNANTLPLPVAGDPGVLPGDHSAILAAIAANKAAVSFNAAGDFGAQTSTIQNYATTIVGALASSASQAQAVYESALFSFDALKERLLNDQGVNIDEELSHITQLETAYQASAQLLRTVQELFDSLLQAVN